MWLYWLTGKEFSYPYKELFSIYGDEEDKTIYKVVLIEGTLTLNYVKVRCVADIHLETLSGTGHLVVLEEVHP